MRAAVVIFFFATAPFVVGFGPPGLIESDQARMPLYAGQLAQVQRSDLPEVSAAAAVAIDGETGQVVYDKEAHTRRAPASMTKVATAIVALEQGNLHDKVEARVNGWAMEGSSIMGLSPGDLLSLKALLIGLLVQSGNDAALAIAEHIGGTVEHFVELMNAKVVELGLKDSHFANPHGLHAEEHYSSAYDIAQLARYAMRYPAFAEMVKIEQTAVEGQNKTYYVKNTNPLLGVYDGADGVKTGYTEEAGYCVVASATRAERRVFVTLMDSKDRARDGTALFDYAFDNYSTVSLALPPSPLYAVSGVDDQRHTLRLASSVRVCLPNWQIANIQSEIRLRVDPDRGVDAQEPVGEVVFYPGDLPAVTIPLVASR